MIAGTIATTTPKKSDADINVVNKNIIINANGTFFPLITDCMDTKIHRPKKNGTYMIRYVRNETFGTMIIKRH